jgi:hypothetical protein
MYIVIVYCITSAFSHSLTLSLSLTNSLTHARTRAHTHTHTHTRTLPIWIAMVIFARMLENLHELTCPVLECLSYTLNSGCENPRTRYGCVRTVKCRRLQWAGQVARVLVCKELIQNFDGE